MLHVTAGTVTAPTFGGTLVEDLVGSFYEFFYAMSPMNGPTPPYNDTPLFALRNGHLRPTADCRRGRAGRTRRGRGGAGGAPREASRGLAEAAFTGIISAKYMPPYVAEFQFSYNKRENVRIFGAAIARC